MKYKYYGVASPCAIRRIFLEPLFLSLFVLVPISIESFFYDLKWQTAILYLFIPWFWGVICQSIRFRNAYVLFKMNEAGIGNRYVFFKWEDIDKAELITVNLTPKLQRRWWYDSSLNSLICLGNPVLGEMGKQKKKQAVFLTLSQKNLLQLKECNNGKSAIVDEFINLYLENK